MSRTDALLLELKTRHRNDDPRFLAAIRPLVDKILDPALSEPTRVSLLELLAETFERDVQIRRDVTAAQDGLRQWFAALRRRLGLG